MKGIGWIIGGAVLVSGGVWFYLHYNSAAQKRLRSLAGPGGSTIVSARDQQAPAGMDPTIFHEPNFEAVNVDLSGLGVNPPL